MSLENIIVKGRTMLVAEKVQLVRNLYLLGIINEEKCEVLQKHNVGELLDILNRAGIKDVDHELIKQMKECTK